MLKIENTTLKNIIDELENKGNTVLFITKFGSHLYGTNTPDSDVDYKGVFIPNIIDIILQKPLKHYTYSSGDKNEKNTKEDIDIQFYSIYKLVNDVYRGDINAIDLLFSYTNNSTTIYKDKNWIDIINLIKQLISKNLTGLKGYMLRQARMYGIKGSRLHDLIKFKELLESDIINKYNNIGEIIDKIDFNKFEYINIWYEPKTNKINGINVLDKKYQVHRTVEFVYEQICRLIDNYGKRSRKAMNDGNIDYKALSHAYRAIIQMEELLKYGEIEFPFKGNNLNEIMKIKNKHYTLKECLKLIEDKMDYVDSITNIYDLLPDNVDNKLKDDILLKIIYKYYNTRAFEREIKPINSGEILLEEFLKPLDIDISEFAEKINVDLQKIKDIINGDTNISDEIAEKLADFFGTTITFWK